MLTDRLQPSIQDCVSAMADNCKSLYPPQRMQVTDILKGLNSFIEPCYAIYDIDSPGLERAVTGLKATITTPEDTQVVARCRQKRINRIKLMNAANSELVGEERPPRGFHSWSCLDQHASGYRTIQ